ncbi:MAG: hypothetical protein M3Q29_12265 [Chloroflexota bacterium]|nr:hypothetical protein [Chloroflexota bacterium]
MNQEEQARDAQWQEMSERAAELREQLAASEEALQENRELIVGEGGTDRSVSRAELDYADPSLAEPGSQGEGDTTTGRHRES